MQREDVTKTMRESVRWTQFESDSNPSWRGWRLPPLGVEQLCDCLHSFADAGCPSFLVSHACPSPRGGVILLFLSDVVSPWW